MSRSLRKNSPRPTSIKVRLAGDSSHENDLTPILTPGTYQDHYSELWQFGKLYILYTKIIYYISIPILPSTLFIIWHIHNLYLRSRSRLKFPQPTIYYPSMPNWSFPPQPLQEKITQHPSPTICPTDPKAEFPSYTCRQNSSQLSSQTKYFFSHRFVVNCIFTPWCPLDTRNVTPVDGYGSLCK